jgi:arginase
MYKHTVNDMGKSMWLVLPEWQGYGLSDMPARGARQLARHLFDGRDVVTIEVPGEEALSVDGGVLGLASLGPRLAETRAAIQACGPDRIFTIGATCGVEVAPIAYLNQKYRGDLAVLWLDAHADLNTPASSPSGHFHGMVLRTLLGDGPAALTDQIPLPLTPAQVCLVGARDLDPPEADFVRSAGIGTAGLEAFNDPVQFARDVRQAGFGRIYLHLDIDVINPEDFGSSLMRTPGGPSLDDVTALVCQLTEQCDIAGASVVEFCDRDQRDAARLSEVASKLFQWV